VFVCSNAEEVIGINNVVDVNTAFFSSIKSMSYNFSGIYESGKTLVCDRRVDYVRLDGSKHHAKFATILILKDSLIFEYKIFAHLSGL
jgi:hypothetical protein